MIHASKISGKVIFRFLISTDQIQKEYLKLWQLILDTMMPHNLKDGGK